jgi:hypothetical protein
MNHKTFWPKFATWFLLGLLIVVHLFLISNTFFIDALGNFRVAVNGYGDIPLHLTQISKFAFNKLDNLADPIFYGAKLQYPFILNFISGFLLKLSQNWVLAMNLAAMILCVANIILLYLIYKRFLKKSLWSAVAVILFFLGSGWGAYPLINQAMQKHQSAQVFVQELTQKDITADNKYDAKANEQNIDFGAPLSMSFLHQRTFFLGFFGFLILWLLVLEIKTKPKWYWVLTAGIILGLMPIWHSHSFIAAVIFMAVFLLSAIIKKNKQFIRHLIVVSIIGFVLAVPQILFLTGSKELFTATGGFIKLRLGWMVEPGIGSIQFGQTTPGVWNWRFLEFIWMNFGLVLPFFLIASIIFISKRVRNNLADAGYANYGLYAIFGLAYFFINQIVKFQPWDFDNNKILVYWLVFAAPLIVYWLYSRIVLKCLLYLMWLRKKQPSISEKISASTI